MRRRRGNVVVVVAGGALVFLSLMSLVIDVGTWYARRVSLQAVADLAVLAALRSGSSGRDELGARVTDAFRANGVETKVAIGIEADDRALVLRVKVREPSARIFSIAVSSLPVAIAVEAVAERDPSGRVTLRP